MNKFISPMQVFLYVLVGVFATMAYIPLSQIILSVILCHSISLIIQHHLRLSALEEKLKDKDEDE